MNEAMENAAKADETKAEKFIRLGEYRMNKAIDTISRIENLANRPAYDYTLEQVEAMFSVLESKVEEVKAEFTAAKPKESTAFSFGGKILSIMKDMDMGIPGLAALSGVREDTLLDIMAGIREADITTLCKVADAPGVCVRELCPDEERYSVPVEKNTLAKLVVVSGINMETGKTVAAYDRHIARQKASNKAKEKADEVHTDTKEKNPEENKVKIWINFRLQMCQSHAIML